MMNKCLCENVFTLGATIETNAIYIYIYRYRDNIYIVVFTHQQQRTTKKKKNEASLAILCNL